MQQSFRLARRPASVSVLVVGLAVCGSPSCPGQAGWPSRDADLDALPGFVDPPAGYGEVAFYWWIGDPLTRERLSWQLDRLAESGGVCGLQVNYAHSDRGGRSYGLTYPSDPPLFSEAWWDLFRWFLGEAKRRGMAASLSDYTLGVPGQGWWVDEILRDRPDLCGSVLEGRIEDVAGGAKVSRDLPEDVLCATAVPADGASPAAGAATRALPIGPARRVEWDAPPGKWKLVTVWPRREPMSIDPMHPDCGKEVIRTFFGRFEERCPGEGGSGLNFFFSDELDFGIGGRLWNRSFADEFRRRKGYDVVPELAALFVDLGPRTPKVRLDYHDVLVALSEEGYFRPVFEWHRERGMLYGCDHGGRGRNVVEFGDYFRTQRWMSGPGCDSPGLSADVVKNKVASSISHLYLRPRTWLEGYHSSGWGTTSAQIVDATFRNFVMGHNLLTLHGLYYTTHGGWWEWAPPCNHFRMPYWPHMRELLGCTERLSYLMSQGHHRCDVAILYPVSPVHAGLGGDAAVGAAFSLAERLFSEGIDYDFIDDDSVARAEVTDGRLSVSGESYRVLVLPAMRAIRFATLEKARALVRGGGIAVAVGALPESSDRIGRDDPEVASAVAEVFGGTPGAGGAMVRRGEDGGSALAAASVEDAARAIGAAFPRDFALVDPGAGRTAARPMVLHRRIGPRDVYMVVGAPEGSTCSFRATGRVDLWDPWTGRTRRLPRVSRRGESTLVRMPLDAAEAQIIVFGPGEAEPVVEETDLDEVTSVERAGGRLEVRGLAGAAGPRSATVRDRSGSVTVRGEAPAPLPGVTLDGPWGVELAPSLDDRFGDFHWPPPDPKRGTTLLGAEVRRFRHASEPPAGAAWHDPDLDDSGWPRVTCSFGPRFWRLGPLPESADASALEARLAALDRVDDAVPETLGGRELRWQPYELSWRFGVEDDPGHQGYHGLKELVDDDFIALGRLVHSATSTGREREEGGSRYYLWTSVPSARDGEARLLLGGLRPAAVWWNGAPLRAAATSLTLRSDSNSFLLRYDAVGRGHAVVVSAAAGATAAEAPVAEAPFSRVARWIWRPGDSASGDRPFRRTFEVPALPRRAVLRIACDNAYAAWIGGEEVGRGSSWQSVDERDVTRRIRPGRNVLAVLGRNDGGPAGLIAELTLEAEDGSLLSVSTDGAWRSGAGEEAGWRDAGFDDARWAPAEELSPFEGSLWATHPQGPPRTTSLADAAEPPPVRPLAMRWLGMPGVLPFDVRPDEARPAGWYRFVSAPGLRALGIVARGELQAWADGRPMRIETAGTRDDGSREYRATVADPRPAPVKVALRIRHERGAYGGAAIPEPIVEDCGPGLLELGDWSRIDGLATYSGGVRYRKTVSLSSEQAASRVALDLGNVVSSAEVMVDGTPVGVRVAPPWRFDLTGRVRAGENRLEVLVYNTVANHYLTVPTRYRGSTVSGLLGPVTIRCDRTLILR